MNDIIDVVLDTESQNNSVILLCLWCPNGCPVLPEFATSRLSIMHPKILHKHVFNLFWDLQLPRDNADNASSR